MKSEPNRLLLGLLNLAENCYGKQHLPYSDKHTLTSVGAVFRINPKAKVDADRLRQALTAIAGVSQEKLSVDATRQLESQLAIDMPDDSLEMILCQRSNHDRDIHKGQVCYPGGHVDPSETDHQAVVREISEEINLDVSDKSKFASLGLLNERAHAYIKRSKVVTMSIYIFLQISIEDIVLKPSPKEMSKAIWTPFNDFWAYDFKRLRPFYIPSKLATGILSNSPILKSYIVDDPKLSDLKFRVWSLMVPALGENLWGLTIGLVSTVVEGFVFGGNREVLEFEEKIKADFFVRCARQWTFKLDSLQAIQTLDYYYEQKLSTFSLGLLSERL